MTNEKLVERLRQWAADPMWADHCEMPKRTVTAAADALAAADAHIKALEDTLSRAETRENGLRANMDEMATLTNQAANIAQRGALRPNP